MQYVYAILTCLAAIGLDQYTKYLVVQQIPLHGTVDLLPGVVCLTHVRNTGAAFSMLAGKRTFFLIITALFLIAVVYCVAKKILTGKYLWVLTFITAGAIGNLIDRMANGYVVDMIETQFMEFAVFNVADIFITLGSIALIIIVLFFDRENEK